MICGTCKHWSQIDKQPFGICMMASKIADITVWRGNKDAACEKHEPGA